jgi:hypothetical protein
VLKKKNDGEAHFFFEGLRVPHRHERTHSSMGPGPMQAEEYLHAQAQKCQRLASESLDVFVREALIELASHYEYQAEHLKQQRQNAS